MRRTLILCVLSAVLGGLATYVANQRPSIAALATADAQEPPRSSRRLQLAQPPGPQFPAAPLSQAQLPPVAPQPRGVAQAAAAAPVDDDLTPEERVSVAVYENCNRSVVNINTKVVRSDTFSLFDIPSEGAGSGSVLDVDGHILTNCHVIDDAREIQVTLYDGKSYEARVIGRDASNDVAVLKIDAPRESLMPVTLGSSERLRVGQRVFAIGNPFGLERTLTTGVISSLDRSLPTHNRRTIKSIIQIDAAINPGNSGGPLLDSRGRLIGMNTAIATKTGQSAGVGFAIPVANIARVAPQLIALGHVIRPDSGIAKVLQTEKGLLIATMTPGGPAEQAGLRGFRIVKQRRRQGPFTHETQSIDRNAADLVIAVDHQPITTASDFLNLVEAKRPGDEAILTVIREGREVDVRLTLAASDS